VRHQAVTTRRTCASSAAPGKGPAGLAYRSVHQQQEPETEGGEQRVRRYTISLALRETKTFGTCIVALHLMAGAAVT